MASVLLHFMFLHVLYSKKKMGSITPVALTAHHAPNLMYSIGTSHMRLELSAE